MDAVEKSLRDFRNGLGNRAGAGSKRPAAGDGSGRAFDFIRIDGDTPQEKRGMLVDRFQLDEGCKVTAAVTKGGEGREMRQQRLRPSAPVGGGAAAVATAAAHWVPLLAEHSLALACTFLRCPCVGAAAVGLPAGAPRWRS